MNTETSATEKVHYHRRRRPVMLPIMLFATAACALVSLAIGPADISFGGALGALLPATAGDGHIALIVREIRLPRTLLALLIGAGLGASGAALQALARNPLAEPGIIGISSMAALGAVAVFYSGLSTIHPLALPAGGFAGAALCVLVLYFLTRRGISVLTLVLAGVAINSLAGALTALALNLSPNPFAAYEIFFWLLGSLANRSIDHVTLVAPFACAGITLLLVAGRDLNAFALGEDVAATLGVGIRRTQFLVITGTALAVGTGVAVAGVIGFVGLVVPHLLRHIVGNEPSALIPTSAFGGAILTLAADTVCRVAFGATELKLGVLTALLGAPFFLMLVLRRRGF